MYVAEQTDGPLGSYPVGYTGLVPGVFVDGGMLGIFPAATAASRAATHAAGSLDVSGVAVGYPADHSKMNDFF